MRLYLVPRDNRLRDDVERVVDAELTTKPVIPGQGEVTQHLP